MELLIALLISVGSITADDATRLSGDERATIEMAEKAGIDQARIDDAKAEVITSEEADF